MVTLAVAPISSLHRCVWMTRKPQHELPQSWSAETSGIITVKPSPTAMLYGKVIIKPLILNAIVRWGEGGEWRGEGCFTEHLRVDG